MGRLIIEKSFDIRKPKEKHEGSATTFMNKPWTRPDQPSQGRKPKTAGETLYVFDEYDTPLGVEIVINHEWLILYQFPHSFFKTANLPLNLPLNFATIV